MKYVIIVISIFLSLLSYADIIENKEPGIIEIQYLKTSVYDTLELRTHSDPMTLRVGKTSAMFYPTKKMWADSLLRTNYKMYEKLYRDANPIGKPSFNPIGGLEREFVFRNVKDGETMVYRSIAGDKDYYVEPTETPAWEIKQDTKEILGYQCQLAECNFRGRKWEAWFSPEIPIHEGPWKLFGLPGLILQANDSKNHYTYHAIGISSRNIGPVGIRIYVKDRPHDIKSRKIYLQKIYRENIKGKFISTMSSLHGNGSQSKPVEAQYDSQETDYPHE